MERGLRAFWRLLLRCIGVEPCMFGSAKVDLPSPPYMVPSSAKRAVFCEMGISCPLQKAQPLGGKLNGKMRISATKGSAMTVSGKIARCVRLRWAARLRSGLGKSRTAR
jgi:hypothetical protein